MPRKQPKDNERFSRIQIVDGGIKTTIRDKESGKCIGLYESENGDQFQDLVLLNEIAESDFFGAEHLKAELQMYGKENEKLSEKVKLMPKLEAENAKLKVENTKLKTDKAELEKRVDSLERSLDAEGVKKLFPEKGASATETKA